MDNLHRAQRADDVARQPDFAVAAAADSAQQFVIGHLRRRSLRTTRLAKVARLRMTAGTRTGQARL